MGVRFRAEAIRELAFGGISGTYANVGTALANISRMIHVTNLTDADLYFSFNGRTDHVILPASGGFFVYDVNANRDTNEEGWYLTPGTQPSVRQVSGAPSSGSVYVSIFYGEG